MVFLDIWRSYRSLPLWVQIWVAGGGLVPVNMAALVLWFVFAMSQGSAAYGIYLWLLLLAFYFPDALKWRKGDRAIAGH